MGLHPSYGLTHSENNKTGHFCIIFLLFASNVKTPTNKIKQKQLTLWETVKGSPLDFRGHPLLLLTVVLLWVLRFLPNIPLLGRGMPPLTLGSDNQQSNSKSNQDGYKKSCLIQVLYKNMQKSCNIKNQNPCGPGPICRDFNMILKIHLTATFPSKI